MSSNFVLCGNGAALCVSARAHPRLYPWKCGPGGGCSGSPCCSSSSCRRKVVIAGIAASTNGLWMRQIGRNLTDCVDGILNGKRYLIHDRDPLFTTEFLDLVGDVGVKSVKLPPRSR